MFGTRQPGQSDSEMSPLEARGESGQSNLNHSLGLTPSNPRTWGTSDVVDCNGSLDAVRCLGDAGSCVLSCAGGHRRPRQTTRRDDARRKAAASAATSGSS